MKRSQICVESLSILDCLHEAILVADINNIAIYVNDAYMQLTGLRREDIIGKNVSVVRPGSKIGKVIKTGITHTGDIKSVGNREWVSNVAPIYMNGSIVGGASVNSNVQEIIALSKELEIYRKNVQRMQEKIANSTTRFTFNDILAVNQQSKETKNFAFKASKKDISVLIMGESGTGKEVYAQAIHNNSERKDKPFIGINCAAIAPNLLESELFGYADGAFTGAKKGGSAGIFEAANGGTVFLDEIGDMDYNAQSKLLRVLQEGLVRPVGSTREKPVNVRIIAATNINLYQHMLVKRFRTDLYYRIASFIITLPPLRERRDDIVPLARIFLEKECIKNCKSFAFSDQALAILQNYYWPGNVRELQNAIKTAAIMTDSDKIEAEAFPLSLQSYALKEDFIKLPTLKEVVRRAEQETIKKALFKYEDTVDGKRKAANALGICVATLYNKMANMSE